MAANAGQFNQQLIANAAGTLTEVSSYITACDPKRDSADTDLTTFSTGGGYVTKTHTRGAAMSEWQLKGLFDPVYAKILRQVIAARSGVAFQQKSGTNAAPTSGDESFTGTYCPLQYTLTYNTGAPATIDTDMKIADGAAAPVFGQI